eukprot:4154294-Pleurochrysis_carterae.AAC.1
MHMRANTNLKGPRGLHQISAQPIKEHFLHFAFLTAVAFWRQKMQNHHDAWRGATDDSAADSGADAQIARLSRLVARQRGTTDWPHANEGPH